MGKGFFRYTTLVIQGLITIAITMLTVWTSVRITGTGEAAYLATWRMGMLCLHALATFIAALLIIHYTKTATGPDVQVMPLLFLAFTLKDMEVVFVSFRVTHLFAPMLGVVAKVFQVSFLLSTFLVLECSIFQAEVNTRKMSQYILIALACSLYFGLTVPISYASDAYLRAAYITSGMLRLFMYIFGGISIVSLVANLLKETPSRNTIIKSIGFTLIIIAHTLQAGMLGPVARFFILWIHIFGLIILVLVARSNRIWG
ncbi:MAG: hypothetical protein LKE39_03610 [Sphaerochaeta sp.]|jgi:hypothetical protein|nr:hypothetical protein [Sphaerochaeta sp.]MCI2096373.1 hypothetical protein [Sphaerochaeta sp.]MCI2104231.1 hypothetical protein [Sphaerochaeta sp.]MCI2128026.1 hypothetical protein [Sphaerochaeta sp.]